MTIFPPIVGAISYSALMSLLLLEVRAEDAELVCEPTNDLALNISSLGPNSGGGPGLLLATKFVQPALSRQIGDVSGNQGGRCGSG